MKSKHHYPLFLLLMVASFKLFAKESPQVTLTSVKLDTSLELTYMIKNTLHQDIYVFSPFLERPFSSTFNHPANELIWTTFPPGFKGNYYSQLEFVKIPPGESFSGHLISSYAALQINGCAKQRPISVRLAVAWSYDTKHAETEWNKDPSTTIAIVEGWQSLALSDWHTVVKTGLSAKKRCPPQDSVEIWR